MGFIGKFRGLLWLVISDRALANFFWGFRAGVYVVGNFGPGPWEVVGGVGGLCGFVSSGLGA